MHYDKNYPVNALKPVSLIITVTNRYNYVMVTEINFINCVLSVRCSEHC